MVSARHGELLERVARIAEWKGRYPVAMSFYDVGIQDPIIGHVAVSNVWPADEFARLCQLYERAKAVLVRDHGESATPLRRLQVRMK